MEIITTFILNAKLKIMSGDLIEIETNLKAIMKRHMPPLQVIFDLPQKFEVSGTIPAMQGKQKVDGFYFASIIPKPKDVRLYFFPIYTHVDSFRLSDSLNKCLKGKSCFHIKSMDKELESEISAIISLGIDLYKKDGLI